MSGNTSATGGYLAPSSGPMTQRQVEDALQGMVVGITGLAGQFVRPRWQPFPPKQPEHSVSWCSIGVTSWGGKNFASVQHQSAGNGQDVVTVQEDLEVMASFYGPSAMDLARRLRQGLAVEQNRAALRASGLALASVGALLNIPEIINNAWVQRVDLGLTVRAEALSAYPVLNLLDVPGSIEDASGLSVNFIPLT